MFYNSEETKKTLENAKRNASFYFITALNDKMMELTVKQTLVRCVNLFKYFKDLVFNFFCPERVHKRIYERWTEDGPDQ